MFLSPAPMVWTNFELIATSTTIPIVILKNVVCHISPALFQPMFIFPVGASLSPFPATNISISDIFSHLFEQLGSTHVYIAIYILFFIFIMIIFSSKNKISHLFEQLAALLVRPMLEEFLKGKIFNHCIKMALEHLHDCCCWWCCCC